MSNQTPKRRIAPDLLSPVPSHPYKIQPIPSKGLGLIATRPITALSTPIIEEHPILRIPSTMDENDDTALAICLERFLLTTTPVLADRKRKETLALSNAHPDKGVLAGILQTNGFQLPAEGEWPACRALFIVVSRINHSCVPNCAQRWDAGRRVMMVLPVEGIEVGEEITLSYLEGVEGMGLGERRESLMDDFGFWCECERCEAEEGSRGEGDDKADGALVGFDKAEDVSVEATSVRTKENRSTAKE